MKRIIKGIKFLIMIYFFIFVLLGCALIEVLNAYEVPANLVQEIRNNEYFKQYAPIVYDYTKPYIDYGKERGANEIYRRGSSSLIEQLEKLKFSIDKEIFFTISYDVSFLLTGEQVNIKELKPTIYIWGGFDEIKLPGLTFTNKELLMMEFIFNSINKAS